jgi:CDP-glycerol glycerophosphotransferase (TagB/SpsB family)
MSDFSTGSSDYQNLAMLDTVIVWARSQPGIRVIHKMHPGEELEYYAAAGRALAWDPLTLTTIREPILYDVLERSDLLVTAYSSTVLEGLVLGTPAIVFDGMVQRKLLHDGPTPLNRVPGVTIVYSTAELREQLDARRSAPPLDRAALRASPELRDYLSGLDGQATARVAALLG